MICGERELLASTAAAATGEIEGNRPDAVDGSMEEGEIEAESAAILEDSGALQIEEIVEVAEPDTIEKEEVIAGARAALTTKEEGLGGASALGLTVEDIIAGFTVTVVVGDLIAT